jgi:hypothetical protein
MSHPEPVLYLGAPAGNSIENGSLNENTKLSATTEEEMPRKKKRTALTSCPIQRAKA